MTSPHATGEEDTTLAEVAEVISLAWTDATHLPDSPVKDVVCRHLQAAAEAVDALLDAETEREHT